MISPNVPDLLTLARERRTARAKPDHPPPAMQPAPDDVRWSASDEKHVRQLKADYVAAPLPLKALMRAVHSTDELTTHERADALHAIANTTVTDGLCQWCHQLPALPHVRLCLFHASRAIAMQA